MVFFYRSLHQWQDRQDQASPGPIRYSTEVVQPDGVTGVEAEDY